MEPAACATLRLNRPEWNVIEGDLREFDGCPYQGIDLLAGGVPCPPFSRAGKQLGAKDERDLFPEALRLVDECRPQAVMLENLLAVDGWRGVERWREKANAIAPTLVGVLMKSKRELPGYLEFFAGSGFRVL